MKARVLIPLFTAVVMASAVTVASGYPYLQAKLSVLFASGLVLVLALIQLLSEVRTRERPRTDEETTIKDPGRQSEPAEHLIEIAWMCAFALGIYFAGFLVAIPVFACLYMKSHGTKWPVAVVTALLLNAFCYVVFIWVLDTRLYSGTMFTP